MAICTVFDLPIEAPIAQLTAQLYNAWVGSPAERSWELYRGIPSPQDHETLAGFMAVHGYPVELPTPAEDVEGCNWLAEAHIALSAGGVVQTTLDPHTDDDGGVSCAVNTMIVYLENTVQGGELVLGDKNGTPHYIVGTHPPAGHVRVVLMRGDVWHYPRDVCGEGRRRSVVYQCERSDH